MKTVKVAVTGAAGQIGYAMLFRLAFGEIFGRAPAVAVSVTHLQPYGTGEVPVCGFLLEKNKPPPLIHSFLFPPITCTQT